MNRSIPGWELYERMIACMFADRLSTACSTNLTRIADDSTQAAPDVAHQRTSVMRTTTSMLPAPGAEPRPLRDRARSHLEPRRASCMPHLRAIVGDVGGDASECIGATAPVSGGGEPDTALDTRPPLGRFAPLGGTAKLLWVGFRLVGQGGFEPPTT